MYGSPVVFFERTGKWAATARRAWSRRAALLKARRAAMPRLIETRSAAECRETAAAHRGSFVIVELEAARVEPALEVLLDLGLRFPEQASAVVAGRSMRSYEELARELGALAFVVSPLEMDGLCNLAERHVRQTVIEPADVRKRIWENLPWK